MIGLVLENFQREEKDMAKFCGNCGSRLNEANGLCPNCDSDKLKIAAKKRRKANRKAKKKEKRAQWTTGKK